MPKDGTNDDCWNRALLQSSKSDKLTPDETIDAAFEAGRIKGELTRAHGKKRFLELHQWASKGWDQIRQRRLDEMGN